MMRDRTPRPAVPIQDVIVIALAANRIARAVSIDAITAPLRDRVKSSLHHDQPDATKAQQLATDLLDCPVCVGWWSSLALSMMWPGSHRIRRGVAVAGAQVMLSLAERLISEEGRLAVHEVQKVDEAHDARAVSTDRA